MSVRTTPCKQHPGEKYCKEERVRLAVRVRQVEDDMIEQFVRMGEVSSVDVGQVFYILAKREFVACNTKYEKKE